MLKLKNSDIQNLLKGKSLVKLMDNPELDSDKAYDLSIVFKKLESQGEIIEKNRVRVSLKYFPMKDGVQEGVITDFSKANEKDTKEFFEKQNKFFEEFNKVLEKEVEIEGEKISLSREKKDGKSELSLLKLTTIDLLSLEKIIDIK